MTLTKAEIIENLSKVARIDKRKAGDLVEMFFWEICSLLEQGKQLRLSGFGNFNLRDKKERLGRNPKTGEDAPITSRRVVTFRAGVKLKERVGKYAGSNNKNPIVR
jgi:integration host factor subunit alpha